MTLKGIFFLLFFLAGINTLIATIDLKGFLSRHSTITNKLVLDEFKKLARKNMYQALVQIVLLVTAGLMGLYGIFTHQLGLILVIALNGAIIVLSKLTKGIEERTRSLTVDDKSLEDQYLAVCETWVGKALPDF
jgi:hypothetical protein